MMDFQDWMLRVENDLLQFKSIRPDHPHYSIARDLESAIKILRTYREELQYLRKAMGKLIKTKRAECRQVNDENL